MRKCFRIPSIGFGDCAPNLFRFRVLPLLFQGHGFEPDLGSILLLRHQERRRHECNRDQAGPIESRVPALSPRHHGTIHSPNLHAKSKARQDNLPRFALRFCFVRR
jgi:hypothetical protein